MSKPTKINILAGTLTLAVFIGQDSIRADEPFQPWVKLGRILRPGFAGDRSASRISAPCVIKLDDRRLRMYFWALGKGKHYIFAAESSTDDPTRWKLVGDGPMLGPSAEGNIRNGGSSFPWVIAQAEGPWLMFFGTWGSWASRGELSNRTCLAISDDQGITWKVVREPLLPLGPAGSFDAGLTGSVCVLRSGTNLYRMWYTAGERYEMIEGRKRGIVHIGYATSRDGFTWQRRPQPLLSPRLDQVKPFEAVVSKPSVLVIDGAYHMWLSVFSMRGCGYRLGYARSTDGIHWQRALDQEILPLSPGEFDSVNQSYPHVIEVGDELWMFYVGNSFGATGIGLAKIKKPALN